MIDGRLGLAAAMARHEQAHGPITIGLAGAGQMGTDIVVQTSLMAGVRIGAICEVRGDLAVKALALSGREPNDLVSTDDAPTIEDAVRRGKVAVTSDFQALCAAEPVDVIIDATGNPNVGAQIALAAMAHGKHVVMLNVEADITIGRHLRRVAKKAGVICTGAAGDEPACTLELIAFAQSLGLEIVCAGKGKNNPLDFTAMPEDYEEEAARRDMNARMLVEFVDGSKTMIEMVAVAQATGLVPDVPGMHGPTAGRDELASILCTEDDGGVLTRSGCVDYSIGKGVAPGVFCIVKPNHHRVLERLIDLKVGSGPCFALMRPYHLTSLEVPLSAVRAVLDRRSDLEPLHEAVAECAVLAKRALAEGEVLGKIGERDYRAWAMTAEEARSADALPLGLAEGARVTKPVEPGALLTYDNCEADRSQPITRIRAEQDLADAA